MTQHTEFIKRLRYEPTASQYLSLADLIASLHEDRKNAADALEAQAREIEGLQAARMAYASEFPPDGEGEPDVGSIHQNIRAMKAEIERLRKDAMRWQNQYNELRHLVDRRPAINAGLIEAYMRWNTECYLLDFHNADDDAADAAMAMKGQP